MKKKINTLAIVRACHEVGGQAVMARYLNVSPPTVNQWVKGIRSIPSDRCPEIEKATKGAVMCEELRPDVDWAYLRRTRLGPEQTNIA